MVVVDIGGGASTLNLPPANSLIPNWIVIKAPTAATHESLCLASRRSIGRLPPPGGWQAAAGQVIGVNIVQI